MAPRPSLPRWMRTLLGREPLATTVAARLEALEQRVADQLDRQDHRIRNVDQHVLAIGRVTLTEVEKRRMADAEDLVAAAVAEARPLDPGEMQRLDDALSLVPHTAPPLAFFDRSLWVPITDCIVHHHILHTGHWAKHEIETLLALLRPGDNVIDVGGHIGCHAVQFARAVGPDGRVVAVEPNPAMMQYLSRNLHHLGHDNVSIWPVAAGAQDQTLELHAVVLNPGASSILEDSIEFPSFAFETHQMTLDDIVAKEGVGPARLLKMDIQSYEPFAIQGAKDLIQRDRPILLIEHELPLQRRGGTRDAALAMVRDLNGQGYRLFDLDPSDESLRPTDFDAVAAWDEDKATNLLAIHGDDQDALTRIRPLLAGDA